MKARHAIKEVLLIASIWTGGYTLTWALADGAGSAKVYALIVAWWATAYFSSRCVFSPLSGFLYGIVYFSAFCAAALLGKTWFYRDVPLPITWMIGIGAAQGLLVASPILFDWGVRRIAHVCRARFRREY